MSKRFGRNQKRRMREEIADLSQAVSGLRAARELDARLLAHQQNIIQIGDEALKRVEKVFGKHTALLPPKPISARGNSRPDGFFEMQTDEYKFNPASSPDNDLVFNRTTTISRLHYVLARVKKEDLPDFGAHVVVNFADRRAAYAATASAIDHMDKRTITQHISESIAQYIVDKL